MFLCQFVFFARFGQFVFMIIIISILAALFLIVPLLLLIGPNGSFGDIPPLYWLSAWLSRKCRRAPAGNGAPADNKVSEATPAGNGAPADNKVSEATKADGALGELPTDSIASV